MDEFTDLTLRQKVRVFDAKKAQKFLAGKRFTRRSPAILPHLPMRRVWHACPSRETMYLTFIKALLLYLRESQPESEPAKHAAVVPAVQHGGRVLNCIQRFIEPHRQPGGGVFCLVKQKRRRHNY
jgi:hypothetical protein